MVFSCVGDRNFRHLLEQDDMDRKFERNPLPDWVEADRYLDVIGIQFRKAAASAFADGEMTILSFEREPNNPNDPNALRVIGTRP